MFTQSPFGACDEQGTALISNSTIMYKAKCNISCENRYFEAGMVYTKAQIKGLDVNDFILVGKDEKEEVKPKSMTTESLKPKKAKK